MKTTYQLIKERVKALEEENEYLKKQYHKTNLMLADISKQDAEKEKYIIELCGRINKTIEYIEENKILHEWTDRGGFTSTDGRYFIEMYVDELLDILKGEDND